MKKQLAIVWLISLATFALAEPTLNSIEQARNAFKGQYTLKRAKAQEHDLDLSELFTPLGFSSEKKFAYFIGYNCSESDNKFEGQLVVLDLTDNRVAFEKDYQDDFQENEFHSILEKLGIKSQGLAPALRGFPFQKDGDTYTVSVTSTILETDKENAEQKREYQIYLVSEKKGKKLVAKFQVDEYYGKARVQSVVGFFQSPFENRIAILTEGFGAPFEGCTSIIHNVYGASLGSGFKK